MLTSFTHLSPEPHQGNDVNLSFHRRNRLFLFSNQTRWEPPIIAYFSLGLNRGLDVDSDEIARTTEQHLLESRREGKKTRMEKSTRRACRCRGTTGLTPSNYSLKGSYPRPRWSNLLKLDEFDRQNRRSFYCRRGRYLLRNVGLC